MSHSWEKSRTDWTAWREGFFGGDWRVGGIYVNLMQYLQYTKLVQDFYEKIQSLSLVDFEIHECVVRDTDNNK